LDEIAILLDVDGTLLDIAPRPDEVRVPVKLRTTLQTLWSQLDGALAFISGRPLADIDRIFEPLKLPAVGGHGAELRPTVDSAVIDQLAQPLDPKLKKLLVNVAKLGPGVLIEDKSYSMAIHYRLAPKLGGDVMRAVAAIAEKYGAHRLELLPGKSVIEIKQRGFDKGTALRQLMTYRRFTGRRPIFVGDDTTDDAAFAVLPEFSGVGLSVGGIVPGASFNFETPHDVRQWLEQLSKQAEFESR
jgi:trehalose 6-phosphate phosphatase